MAISPSHNQPTVSRLPRQKVSFAGIDVLGCFPGKAKQNRLVRAVPDPVSASEP